MMSDYLSTGAVFSEDQRYRYLLWRVWSYPMLAETEPAWTVSKTRSGAGVTLSRNRSVVAFCGLNPSTADATQDDPTIRRCVGFAKAWGYAGLLMVNRFSFRSTDPKRLPADPDERQGYGGRDWFAKAVSCCDLLVCAWGANYPEDSKRLSDDLRFNHGSLVHHLGLTKDGHPRHPLYLRGDTQPVRWAP
jgi:hypothetical protein